MATNDVDAMSSIHNWSNGYTDITALLLILILFGNSAFTSI